MRFAPFVWLTLVFVFGGCPEVDPRNMCEKDAECHEGYVCDTNTKTCLRGCTANADCIDKSQLCDVNVCRTACISANDCDPAYQCIKDESAQPEDPGICRDI